MKEYKRKIKKFCDSKSRWIAVNSLSLFMRTECIVPLKIQHFKRSNSSYFAHTTSSLSTRVRGIIFINLKSSANLYFLPMAQIWLLNINKMSLNASD